MGAREHAPKGGDLTISRKTTVDIKPQQVNYEIYPFDLTVSYTFKKNVAIDRFVIFATCSALLRDSISSGCRLPLFEMWYTPDSSLFQHSVDDMLPSVRIGIEYIDDQGQQHVAQSSPIQPTEVKVNQWPNYLTFFREAMGNLPKQNAGNYLSELRIFECDLSWIAGNHAVNSVERLTLRSATRQRVDDGYCF